jgi:hypothetical protein
VAIGLSSTCSGSHPILALSRLQSVREPPLANARHSLDLLIDKGRNDGNEPAGFTIEGVERDWELVTLVRFLSQVYFPYPDSRLLRLTI